MKSIEISARTVAEAIQLALAQLGKDRDEVAIEVLEAGSEDEEALVRVTAVDDEEETARIRQAPPPGRRISTRSPAGSWKICLSAWISMAMSPPCDQPFPVSGAIPRKRSRCMSKGPMRRPWGC